MLRTMDVPNPYKQPLAVETKEVANLIGSIAGATIKKGEQITWTKISRPRREPNFHPRS